MDFFSNSKFKIQNSNSKIKTRTIEKDEFENNEKRRRNGILVNGGWILYPIGWNTELCLAWQVLESQSPEICANFIHVFQLYIRSSKTHMDVQHSINCYVVCDANPMRTIFSPKPPWN